MLMWSDLKLSGAAEAIKERFWLMEISLLSIDHYPVLFALSATGYNSFHQSHLSLY